MQHGNPSDSQEQWQHKYSYQGEDGGQKLRVDADRDDDEYYAEQIVLKVKQQLHEEFAEGRDDSIKYRLALAIVSISLLVPIFITFVVALSLGLGNGGSGIALGYGIVFICVAIMVVNITFNRRVTHSNKKVPLKE